MINKALLLVFFISSLYSYGSHAAGGQISYSPTGNLNEYNLTLTLYRDCNGVNAPTTPSILVNNNCGFVDFAVTLSLTSTNSISQICTSQISNSSCNGGNFLGFEEYVYEGTFVLANTCDEWVFSYNLCDRNASTNVASVYCFFIETTLDNLNYPQNSSPYSTSQNPIYSICNGIPSSIQMSMIDVNSSNQLSYSFIDSYYSQSSTVIYNTGFSGVHPIPGITINQNTGLIQVSPIISGIFEINVLIEEHDSIGNFIGSTMRDLQIIVEDCPNNVPQYDSVNFIFNNNGTGSVLNQNQIITMCQGDEFCMDVQFFDLDFLDVLTLSSDINSSYPSASFVQTGTNPATAHICLPDLNNLNSATFSIYASDNTCPYYGIATKSYQILTNGFYFINDTIFSCNSQNFISSNQDVYWTDLNMDTLDVGTEISCNPCTNPSFLNVNADKKVIASVQSLSCSTQDTLVIIHANSNANISEDTIYNCSLTPLYLVAPDLNATNIWNSTFFQDTIISILNSNNLDYYYLESYLNGCSSDFDTIIVYNGYILPPTILVGQGGLYTSVYNNYQWYYNNTFIPGENNQSTFPTNNGYYQVEVVNEHNCISISDYFPIFTASMNLNENLYDIISVRKSNSILIENQHDQLNYSLIGINGQLIEQVNLKAGSTEVFLPDSNQIYILNIYNSEGQLVLSKKI